MKIPFFDLNFSLMQLYIKRAALLFTTLEVEYALARNTPINSLNLYVAASESKLAALFYNLQPKPRYTCLAAIFPRDCFFLWNGGNTFNSNPLSLK